MKRIFLLVFLLPLLVKAQVYQSMPQAGYGAVKRMLFDSVLSLPLGISKLQNISGGRDIGQIRYNTIDSSIYIYSGSAWRKIGGGDTTNLSNRINNKVSIFGDTIIGTLKVVTILEQREQSAINAIGSGSHTGVIGRSTVDGIGVFAASNTGTGLIAFSATSNHAILGDYATGLTVTNSGRVLIGTNVDNLTDNLQIGGKIKATNIIDNASQTYNSTVTWGGLAPVTSLQKSYRWSRFGNWVFLNISLLYSIAGNANSVTMTLPAGVPLPANVPGSTNADNINFPATGIMHTSEDASSNLQTPMVAYMRISGAGTGYKLVISTPNLILVRYATISIMYFTN